MYNNTQSLIEYKNVTQLRVCANIINHDSAAQAINKQEWHLSIEFCQEEAWYWRFLKYTFLELHLLTKGKWILV